MIVPALDNTVKSLLMRAGVENPAGDAKEILCAVLACDRAQLLLREEEIPDPLCEKAIAMAHRRAGGEPIQYILGSWSFMGCDYKVGEGVLIPRDDTEVVVTQALKLCENTPDPVIVDLCAGRREKRYRVLLSDGKHCAQSRKSQRDPRRSARLHQRIFGRLTGYDRLQSTLHPLRRDR